MYHVRLSQRPQIKEINLLPHLPGVELKEGEVGGAGDAVQAEDAVRHPPPHPDQACCDGQPGLPQLGARGQQLPPDDVHQVVLLVLLL